MKTKLLKTWGGILLAVMAVCGMAWAATATKTVVSDSVTGVLGWPTNLFSANSNALNAAIEKGAWTNLTSLPLAVSLGGTGAATESAARSSLGVPSTNNPSLSWTGTGEWTMYQDTAGWPLIYDTQADPTPATYVPTDGGGVMTRNAADRIYAPSTNAVLTWESQAGGPYTLETDQNGFPSLYGPGGESISTADGDNILTGYSARALFTASTNQGPYTNIISLPLPLFQGGTEATNAAGARSSLGIAEWTTNSAVPAPSGPFTNITAVPIPVAEGGTGASDASGARTALGLGSMATVDSPVPVANGGTAATDTGNARLNLGLGSVATEDVVPVAKGGTGVGATGAWVPTFLAAADTGAARTALGITSTNVSGYNATQFDAGSSTNISIKSAALTTNLSLKGTYPFIDGTLITPGPTKAFSDFATGITGWSGWNGGSVAWNTNDQNIKIVTSSETKGANTPASLTSGRIYRLTLNVLSNEVGSGTFFGVANWANYIGGVTNIGAVGAYDITFTAPATGTLILVASAASTNYLDNVHVYEVTGGATRNIVVQNDLVRSNYVTATTNGLYTNFLSGLVGLYGQGTRPVLVPESQLLAGSAYVWNDGDISTHGVAGWNTGVVTRDSVTNTLLVYKGAMVGDAAMPTNTWYRLSWSQTNMGGGGFIVHRRWGGGTIATNVADGNYSVDFFQENNTGGYGTRPIFYNISFSGTNVLDNVHLQTITPVSSRTYALASDLVAATNGFLMQSELQAWFKTNEYVVLDDDFTNTFAWTKTWSSTLYTNDTAAGSLTFWYDSGESGFYRNLSTTIGERYGISALVTNATASTPVWIGGGWSMHKAPCTNGWNHVTFTATAGSTQVGFWNLVTATNMIHRYVVTRMPEVRGVAHLGDVWAIADGITNRNSVFIGSGSVVNDINQVAVGRNSTATMGKSVAIGYEAEAFYDSTGIYGGFVSSGPENMAIGEEAKACAWRATAVGGKAIAASTSSMAIGPYALCQKVHGVALGRGAAIWTNTPNATLVLGVDPNQEVYFGNTWGNGMLEHPLGTTVIGGTNNPAAAYSRLNGPSGFDARTNAVLLGDCPGGPIKIAGGRSTGSGTGGEIHFETSPATGAAGTNTQNALVIAGKFDATTTTNSGSYCATRFLLLDTVSGTTKRVYLHPTPDSGGTGFRMLVTPN